MSRLLTLAIALSLSGAAYAQADKAPTFDSQRLSAHVKTLSSDEFEGRGPATPGEKKTIDYIVSQFEQAGLQPGGAVEGGKRGWTQPVPLRRSSIEGPVLLTLKSGDSAQKLSQGEEIAVRAALDGSSRVKFDDVPLVFVGYGVKAPERNWDDFKGVDLKGKIAVVLVNDPDFPTGKGDFGGPAMTYYGRWTYKFEEAARQGAVGLLIVHETAAASYGWATVKNSNTNTMFDVVRDDPRDTHAQLEGWIQRDLAVDLFKRAGLDFDALSKQAQTREFKPVELGATLSADYAVKTEVITSYNVAGRIEGAERPDEVVIYSGHWDHLGVGQPDANGDRIYNGAVDNGTGIASLIELARAYEQQPNKPQRSIVFLAVTAEEKGLLGTEYYASNPLYPLGKTVGVINMDALDPAGLAKNFTTSGDAKQDLQDALIEIGQRWNLAFAPDPHPEAGSFFRSDHFPFAKRGVPAVSFGSGNDFIEGGVKAGDAAEQDYTEKRYHQPDDEWDASWTFAGMARDLQMLFTLGNELANSTRWPNWDPASEFRAARDETAAERK